MPDAITLTLDSKLFHRNMKRLSDVEVGRAMSIALNKTAFEILDAEKIHAGEVFDFSGAATRQFLAGRGSFRFDAAKPARLEAAIYPNPGPAARRADIFESQHRGGVFRPLDRGRFVIEGQVAVPILKARGRSPAGLRRTGRGRVRRIRRGKAKTFITGGVVLERESGGRGGRWGSVRALFALVPAIRIAPVFEFYRTARDSAARHWPVKAKQAFAKIRFPKV